MSRLDENRTVEAVEIKNANDAAACALMRELHKAKVKAYDNALREWVESEDGIDIDGERLDYWRSTRTTYDAETTINMLLDFGAEPEDVARITKIKSVKDLEFLVKEKMGNPVIEDRDGSPVTLWDAIQELKDVTETKRFEFRKTRGKG